MACADHAVIDFVLLDRPALSMLSTAPEDFAHAYGVDVSANADLLTAVAIQTQGFLERLGCEPRWCGYLGVDHHSREVVGTCAFKGPPDEQGNVEIAYFTFPGGEGRGYGTAMAGELARRALSDAAVRRVVAHTLPRMEASTHILQKLGFVQVSEVTDPDDGAIWRWELRRPAC